MNQKDNILIGLNKLVPDQSATVLIIGSPGVGKHELAKTVVSCKKKSFSINVRTAISLPLGPDEMGTRPRIDLVVFVIDLINRHSLLIAEKSLKYLDTEYFVGKTCFVATHVESQSHRSIDVEKITQLADNYDSPLLTVNMEDEQSKIAVGDSVVNLLEIAAGFKPNICPLLIETTRMPFQTEKL